MAASEKAPKPAENALVAGGAEPKPDRSKWTWAARHRVSAVALALLAVGILAAAIAVYQHWAGDAKNIVRIELSGKPITVPAQSDTIDALVGGQGGLYRHALIYDAALIAGYLVAIPLACLIGAQLASTAFGRRVFRLAIGAAIAAALLDVAEDVTLWQTLPRPIAADKNWAV